MVQARNHEGLAIGHYFGPSIGARTDGVSYAGWGEWGYGISHQHRPCDAGTWGGSRSVGRMPYCIIHDKSCDGMFPIDAASTEGLGTQWMPQPLTNRFDRCRPGLASVACLPPRAVLLWFLDAPARNEMNESL